MSIQSELTAATTPAGTERGVLVRTIGTNTVSVGGSVAVTGTVTSTPNTGSLTDKSSTIAAGGTSQLLATANASRKYFFLENLSAENLWLNFTTTAVAAQPSIKLTPGSSFVMESSFISVEAAHIIGATTGSAFVAKEAG